MPNVLSLSGFPGLKNLSQKCLFLNSLVLSELAEFAGRVLNKLKKGDKGTKSLRDKESKRQREEESKRRRDGGRKTKTVPLCHSGA